MKTSSEAMRSLDLIQHALDEAAIVAITDPHGRIMYVNSKFCEVSGYSREELIGQNHRILKSGHHDEAFYRSLWNTISSGQNWEGEIKNRRKDGEFYWVRTFIKPFLGVDGKVKEYVSIRWEITEQKENEENLKNLMDAAFEGLLHYDLSGRVVWGNRKAGEILGLAETELLGKYVPELFGERLGLFSAVTERVRQPGRVLDVSVKPFHLGRRGYLVVFRDVTERDRLEAQILQQDRLASVGLLASGLAHEIGTPLGVMQARAELALMGNDLPDKARDSLQIIIQQIERITALMKSLLGLARRNQDVERPAPVELRRTVEENALLLSHELRKNGVELQNEIAENLRVMAVTNSLFQVILNFLVNAVHAVAERRKGEPDHAGLIRVSAREAGSDILISIEDNGTGIAPENLSRLFTPFFTTKDVGKGTGLGLATNLKIVQAWGGDIRVDSEPGAGTRFTVCLKKA